MWHISTFLGPSTRRTVESLQLVHAALTWVPGCIRSALWLAGSMHAGGYFPNETGARARCQPRQSEPPPQPPSGSPAAPQNTAPRSPPPRSAPAPSAACATRVAPAQRVTSRRSGDTLGRAGVCMRRRRAMKGGTVTAVRLHRKMKGPAGQAGGQNSRCCVQGLHMPFRMMWADLCGRQPGGLASRANRRSRIRAARARSPSQRSRILSTARRARAGRRLPDPGRLRQRAHGRRACGQAALQRQRGSLGGLRREPDAGRRPGRDPGRRQGKRAMLGERAARELGRRTPSRRCQGQSRPVGGGAAAARRGQGQRWRSAAAVSRKDPPHRARCEQRRQGRPLRGWRCTVARSALQPARGAGHTRQRARRPCGRPAGLALGH